MVINFGIIQQTVVAVNNVASPRQLQRSSNKCAPREFGTKLQKKKKRKRKPKTKKTKTENGKRHFYGLAHKICAWDFGLKQ